MGSIYYVLPILAIAVNVAVGIFVITRDHRNIVNRLFLGIIASLVVWSFGELLMNTVDNVSQELAMARVAAFGWCLVGAFFVHFCMELTDWRPYRHYHLLLGLLYGSGLALLALTCFTHLVFRGFRFESPFYFEIMGPLRILSKVYVAGLFIAGTVILLIRWRKASSAARKTRIGYVLIAALIPIVEGIVGDIILPMTNTYLPISAPVVSPLMSIIIAYAVTRYDLMTTVSATFGGAIVENITDAVFITDAEDDIETVNPAAVKLTGYDEGELKEKRVDSLFLQSTTEPAAKVEPAAQESTAEWNLCLTKGGEIIPVTTSVGTVRKKSGKKVGSVVVVHDMSNTMRLVEAEREMRLAESAARAERSRSQTLIRVRDELQEQTEFLEGIIENIAEPVFIKDREYKFVYVNKALCDLVGFSSEEMLGKTDYEFFPREQADFFREKDELMFLTGEIVEIEEERIDDSSGAAHVLRTLKAPLRNEMGEPEYLVGIISDITKQREIESLRLDFIRTAAHELRTPLTSLKLGFELLARETRGQLNAEQQRSLDVLSFAIQRMTRLSKNLLDLATMDAGLMQLRTEPTDIEILMKEALVVFDGQMKGKGLEYSIEVDEDSRRVMADPNRLYQVIHNLVGNAIKYTEDGHVTLSARRGEPGFVEVCVADTGVGIPSVYRDSIFERFAKAGNAETAQQGTGLGLSIAKSIVEMHGGRMWVDSHVGEGSRFFFTVRAA